MRRRLDDRHVRDLLLVALTASSGAVDAISFLALGNVFSSFMTGNIVFLGFEAAGAQGPGTVRAIAALAAFAAGAGIGARIAGRPDDDGVVWPQRVTLVLAAATVLQAAFLFGWLAANEHPSTYAAHALIATSALSMGLQTAAVFRLGVRGVFSTAATATWTAFMGDLALWSHTREERRRLGGVLVGLFAGAVAGALLLVHARPWAPVVPLAVSATVVVVAAGRLGYPARGMTAASSVPPSGGLST